MARPARRVDPGQAEVVKVAIEREGRKGERTSSSLPRAARGSSHIPRLPRMAGTLLGNGS